MKFSLSGRQSGLSRASTELAAKDRKPFGGLIGPFSSRLSCSRPLKHLLLIIEVSLRLSWAGDIGEYRVNKVKHLGDVRKNELR